MGPLLHITETASDPLLGWYRLRALDGKVHDFYVRQLWDGEASIDLDGRHFLHTLDKTGGQCAFPRPDLDHGPCWRTLRRWAWGSGEVSCRPAWASS